MENNTTLSKYKIPQDVVMDILRILIPNRIRHTITGVMRRENSMLLEVHFKAEGTQLDARENIEAILADYETYMKDVMPDGVLLLDEEDEEETY